MPMNHFRVPSVRWNAYLTDGGGKSRHLGPIWGRHESEALRRASVKWADKLPPKFIGDRSYLFVRRGK